MAKQLDTLKAYERQPNENFSDHHARLEKLIEELTKQGKHWQYPVADGYAHYEIVKTSPLSLRHIPYGDGYQVPSAHIRGLRWADIQKDLDWEKRLFGMTKPVK